MDTKRRVSVDLNWPFSINTNSDLFYRVSIAHRLHRSILIDTRMYKRISMRTQKRINTWTHQHTYNSFHWTNEQTVSNAIILIARRINHRISTGFFVLFHPQGKMFFFIPLMEWDLLLHWIDAVFFIKSIFQSFFDNSPHIICSSDSCLVDELHDWHFCHLETKTIINKN